MAQEKISTQEAESNPFFTPWAQVHYVSESGTVLDFDGLRWRLQELSQGLENIKQTAEAAGQGAIVEEIAYLIEDVSYMTPDADAMEPELDPITAARKLLQEECRNALDLLKTESARQHKEAMKKEAFCLPYSLFQRLIKAVKPEVESEEEWNAIHAAAEKELERFGWVVEEHVDNPAYIEKRAVFFRQLRDLTERYPLHYLTTHTLEVLRLALSWCENTSHAYPSPITGVANGNAPEGIFFPRISLELIPFKTWRDVPKEWREPLSKQITAKQE